VRERERGQRERESERASERERGMLKERETDAGADTQNTHTHLVEEKTKDLVAATSRGVYVLVGRALKRLFRQVYQVLFLDCERKTHREFPSGRA